MYYYPVGIFLFSVNIFPHGVIQALKVSFYSESLFKREVERERAELSVNFTFSSELSRKLFVCRGCSVPPLTFPSLRDTAELRGQRSHPMPSAPDIRGRFINFAGPQPCPSVRGWHTLPPMDPGRVEAGLCMIPELLQSI